jgi:hypothetical protein
MWYSLLEDFLEIFGVVPSARRVRSDLSGRLQLARVESRPTVTSASDEAMRRSGRCS